MKVTRFGNEIIEALSVRNEKGNPRDMLPRRAQGILQGPYPRTPTTLRLKSLHEVKSEMGLSIKWWDRSASLNILSPNSLFFLLCQDGDSDVFTWLSHRPRERTD